MNIEMLQQLSTKGALETESEREVAAEAAVPCGHCKHDYTARCPEAARLWSRLFRPPSAYSLQGWLLASSGTCHAGEEYHGRCETEFAAIYMDAGDKTVFERRHFRKSCPIMLQHCLRGCAGVRCAGHAWQCRPRMVPPAM